MNEPEQCSNATAETAVETLIVDTFKSKFKLDTDSLTKVTPLMKKFNQHGKYIQIETALLLC